MRWQYTSVQWQGNAHPVASVQVLINRTLGELCNVMETHLTEFTLTLLTVDTTCLEVQFVIKTALLLL